MGTFRERDELWNLTRGDAEDNRASPRGRGWRSLAVSTALDFNYLGAAITFIWLVVLPAILVGLAVPGVIALARWKLEAATVITVHPATGLLALVVLVALLWLAKPIALISLDNLWHLHHTLVFPLFVLLREVIAMGLEGLSPRSIDAHGLHRLRRTSTVFATLLLAGGGVALALMFPFSTLGWLENLRNARPAALAHDALTNALVVFGISAAVVSLYWFGLELSSATPVLDWAPGQPLPAARILRIAHLSDLHLVGERYGYRMESGTSGPRGNDRAFQAFCQLDSVHATQAFDAIVVTGDITDTGTRAEWLEFFTLLHASPGVRGRLMFVPGNHDVNIIDRANPGRLDLPWSVTGALRKLRVILAMDAVQGESVHVVDRRTGTVGPTLEQYLRTGTRPALLQDLAKHGSWRGRWEAVKVWDRMYPLVVPASGNGCGIILLDSNASRHFSLTNAIGLVSRDQLRALNSVLQSTPAAMWIVAVHHHLVEYPIRGLGLKERVGVVLVNAPDVLRVIARCDRPVVIMHGHRHRDWMGTRGGVVLCSAPSATLGDKGSQDGAGRFSLYQIALGSDGRMQVNSVERVKVTSTGDR